MTAIPVVVLVACKKQFSRPAKAGELGKLVEVRHG
jgi:hypothetical protein